MNAARSERHTKTDLPELSRVDAHLPMWFRRGERCLFSCPLRPNAEKHPSPRPTPQVAGVVPPPPPPPPPPSLFEHALQPSSPRSRATRQSCVSNAMRGIGLDVAYQLYLSNKLSLLFAGRALLLPPPRKYSGGWEEGNQMAWGGGTPMSGPQLLLFCSG